jgi:hypothetical protein
VDHEISNIGLYGNLSGKMVKWELNPIWAIREFNGNSTCEMIQSNKTST